jgi:hypothetical protein
MKPDTPQEMAFLDRAKTWTGLIGWCEEMERGEIEAEVGYPVADPSRSISSYLGPGGAPALKSLKPGKLRGGYDPKTMTRAVARDLGLI